MIAWERLRGAEGALVVRYTGTSRPEELNRLIRAEHWTAQLLFTYGCLLLEVWGAPSVLPAAPVDDDEFITIEQAAAEVGISPVEFVECMIRDGLLIELDGELVPSPHPDIQKAPPTTGER